MPKSEKYTQFKQEMSDVYFQKYQKIPESVSDVSWCAVYMYRPSAEIKSPINFLHSFYEC